MLLFVNLTFCLKTSKQICFSDKFMLNFNKSAKSSNSFCCNSCFFLSITGPAAAPNKGPESGKQPPVCPLPKCQTPFFNKCSFPQVL